MAYRSDVRIVVSSKGYEELKKYVSDNLPPDLKQYNLLDNTDIKLLRKDQIMLGWNAVKWYEYADFKEVDSIMDGLDSLKDKNYSYRYVRLGEQFDDIDEKYVDGELDKDIFLEYPQIERYFNDDLFIIEVNKNEKMEV